MRSGLRPGPKRRLRISEYTARMERAASKESTYAQISFSDDISMAFHGGVPVASGYVVCQRKTTAAHVIGASGAGRKRIAPALATASASASGDPLRLSRRAATTSPAWLTAI